MLNSVTGLGSGFTVSGANTITGNYETQYLLLVSSAYGTTSGSGYYAAGSTEPFSVNTPVLAVLEFSIRYRVGVDRVPARIVVQVLLRLFQ